MQNQKSNERKQRIVNFFIFILFVWFFGNYAVALWNTGDFGGRILAFVIAATVALLGFSI